jgi:malate synthase
MEDLATDRIYRLMLAQRVRHGGVCDESGLLVAHTADFLSRLFDEELEKLLSEPKLAEEGTADGFQRARRIAEAMVRNEEFNPI